MTKLIGMNSGTARVGLTSRGPIPRGQAPGN